MKIIAALLLLCSSVVMAQPRVTIGENDKGSYLVKVDSFTKSEGNNPEYIGMSVDFLPTNATVVVDHANYKMLSQDCGANTTQMLQTDDEGNTTRKINVNLKDGGLQSVMAALICEWASNVKSRPEINQYSLQNIKSYVYKSPESAWTPMMDAKGFDILKDSIRFENIYVSMLIRVQFAGNDKPDYFKLYIDKDYCKDKKGIFEMKTLDAIELKDREFDLTHPAKGAEDTPFWKSATIMCDYTMKNNVFRKRIDLTGKTL